MGTPKSRFTTILSATIMYAVFFVDIILVNAAIEVIDANSLVTRVKEQDLILLNFFAPWPTLPCNDKLPNALLKYIRCGHCKKLESELDLAAEELKENDMEVKIVSIDATSPLNHDMCERMKIDGYPTLAVFKNGKRIADYAGIRSRGAIVEYLTLKSGPPVIAIESINDLRIQCQKIHQDGMFSNGIVVVALGTFPPASLESGQGPSGYAAAAFASAATKYDQTIFLSTSSTELMRHFHVEDDTLLVFSSSLLKPSGSILLSPNVTPNAILHELLRHAIPLIVQYNSFVQPFLQALPVKAHVLIFVDENNKFDEASAVISIVESVAPKYRGSLVFLEVSVTEHQLHQFFDITVPMLPQVVIADMTESTNMRRYKFNDFAVKTDGEGKSEEEQQQDGAHKEDDGDEEEDHLTHKKSGLLAVGNFNARSFEAFLDAFVDKKLLRALKSEVPEVDDNSPAYRVRMRGKIRPKPGTVTTLVAKTFVEKVVEEVNTDYFVYFYAPWCGHCKAFEPTLVELVGLYRPNPGVAIARMDCTKNEVDHAGVRVRGYPSFYLFPAGDKHNPIEYHGERTAKAIANFINSFGRSNNLPAVDPQEVNSSIGGAERRSQGGAMASEQFSDIGEHDNGDEGGNDYGGNGNSNGSNDGGDSDGDGDAEESFHSTDEDEGGEDEGEEVTIEEEEEELTVPDDESENDSASEL